MDGLFFLKGGMAIGSMGIRVYGFSRETTKMEFFLPTGTHILPVENQSVYTTFCLHS